MYGDRSRHGQAARVYQSLRPAEGAICVPQPSSPLLSSAPLLHNKLQLRLLRGFALSRAAHAIVRRFTLPRLSCGLERRRENGLQAWRRGGRSYRSHRGNWPICRCTPASSPASSNQRSGHWRGRGRDVLKRNRWIRFTGSMMQGRRCSSRKREHWALQTVDVQRRRAGSSPGIRTGALRRLLLLRRDADLDDRQARDGQRVRGLSPRPTRPHAGMQIGPIPAGTLITPLLGMESSAADLGKLLRNDRPEYCSWGGVHPDRRTPTAASPPRPIRAKRGKK